MIRVGIGGWTFAPWRDNFYPADLPHSRELGYASRQVTAIEVNGTFYGTQKPASFRRWHEETPDDFVFSLKGPRFVTHRKALGEAGPSIQRFMDSGVSELKEKLGPLLWQFPPTLAYDEANFGAFLELLPRHRDGLKLRHAVEVRHPSFVDAGFIELARRHRVPVVFADSFKHPMLYDITGDFIYARLQKAEAELPTGYSDETLDLWAERARLWSSGGDPKDLPHVHSVGGETPRPRDCFIFMINGAKERAPAGAIALLQRLAA
jgi:uncharacterized protein YecE (DUF72 family)